MYVYIYIWNIKSLYLYIYISANISVLIIEISQQISGILPDLWLKYDKLWFHIIHKQVD